MGDVMLHRGDCLEILPTLEAGSVDAIVTDPPYYRITREPWDAQWDSPKSYLEWLGRVADEWRRILKSSGSLYVFASPQMAARVECLIADRFNVINSIVWQKDFPCGALRYGAENFRGFVEMSERIIFAEQEGADGRAMGESGWAAKCDEAARVVFGRYIAAVRARHRLTMKDLTSAIGAHGAVNHGGACSNWEAGYNVPTREHYEKLQVVFPGCFDREYEDLRREYEDLRREYEDLRREYEDLRRPFFAREDRPHADVWTFKPVKQSALLHPCEKPLRLLAHILECSTRPGDLVLDGFAGSGSTLVACMKAGRRAIGIEKDPRYIPVIERRLKAAETPLFAGLPDGRSARSTPDDAASRPLFPPED